MTLNETEAELAKCRRLLVLAYDDDCGLMAWSGKEDLLLRAFEAEGSDESYWINLLKERIRESDKG